MQATPQIFARISGNSELGACLTYHTPNDDATEAEVRAWMNQDEQAPDFSLAALNGADVSHLPELSEGDAEQVAEHAHYSGACALFAAKVLAMHGFEEMVSYCEFTSYSGMQGAPERGQ